MKRKEAERLAQKIFEIRDQLRKLQERDKKYRSRLISYMDPKKIDFIDSGSNRLLRIIPTSVKYNIAEMIEFVNKKEIRKKALSEGIDIDDLIETRIETTYIVNEEILEQLLKKKIIKKKDRKKLITIEKQPSHLRASNVPKNETE